MTRKKTCVAFGSFEFVHKGHGKIAERLVQLAAEKELQPVILSLPNAGDVYTTEKEKAYLFRKMGIHQFISYEHPYVVTELLSYIKNELSAEWILLGENHPYLNEIQDFARKIQIGVEVIAQVCYKEEVICHEKLVECFEKNDFEMLAELCGHPYILMGDVVHGKKLGRTVGMPTINLHIYKKKRRPHSGVYATRVNLDEESYLAATNIGKRPTVDDFDYVTIETFILDFDQQVYGEICVLEIHRYLRGVKKFENLEQVQEQVKKDVVQVRDFFENFVNFRCGNS